jgi:hypothetical protein
VTEGNILLGTPLNMMHDGTTGVLKRGPIAVVVGMEAKGNISDPHSLLTMEVRDTLRLPPDRLVIQNRRLIGDSVMLLILLQPGSVFPLMLPASGYHLNSHQT